jgi:hypothetical protein
MMMWACYTGGVRKPKCPYQCTSEKYRMPNCYTMLEDLIYTLGGPWLFTLLLSCIMVILALVLSVARVKLVGDDFTTPPPAPHGAHIDHSFPFLESLEEVIRSITILLNCLGNYYLVKALCKSGILILVYLRRTCAEQKRHDGLFKEFNSFQAFFGAGA